MLEKSCEITAQPLLVRLDGGNDSLENVDVIMNFSEEGEIAGRKYVDFIIKWNPRQEDKQDWLKIAEKQASWTQNREGANKYLNSTLFYSGLKQLEQLLNEKQKLYK